MKLKIRLVQCDDWQALYLTNKPAAEGHHIYANQLIRCINALINYYKEPIEELDYGEYWVTDEYAENGFPEYLSQIPDDVFF